jgi:hypothetical protein
MAFAPKAIADGELPTTLSVLFTATANIGTYVKELTLFNNNAVNQVIELFVNRQGVDRSWRRLEIELNEQGDALTDGETMLLEVGDTISGRTTTASAVDFIISGVEEK